MLDNIFSALWGSFFCFSSERTDEDVASWGFGVRGFISVGGEVRGVATLASG